MNLAFSDRSAFRSFSFWLFLIGFALRLISALWPESFWFDELFTVHFAKLPLAESLFLDNHPPTFYVLLKGWLAVLGELNSDSEPLLRLLPFAISILGLLIFFKCFTSLGARVAMALNPASIFFASEVRHHSLFELMSIVFIVQAKLLLDASATDAKSSESRRSAYWFFSAASVGLILSHFLGVVLILSFLGLWVLKVEKIGVRSNRRIWIIAAAVAVCGLGLAIEKFWIHSNYLGWLSMVHRDAPWHRLTEPLMVLGSYSRVWTFLMVVATIGVAYRGSENCRMYATWLLIFILGIYSTEIIFNRSLGFRKFMIPGHILGSIALGTAATEYARRLVPFQWRKGPYLKHAVILVIVMGLVISLKKIGEDIWIPRSGWKTLMIRECKQVAKDPIRIWGHPSFEFYFPESCARISQTLDVGDWYASRDLAVQMLDDKRYTFELLEVIEPKALEPIHHYRVQAAN